MAFKAMLRQVGVCTGAASSFPFEPRCAALCAVCPGCSCRNWSDPRQLLQSFSIQRPLRVFMGIGLANVINRGQYVLTLGAYFATPSIHVYTLTSRICLCFLDSVQALRSHLRLQDAFQQRQQWLAGFCPTVDMTYYGRHQMLTIEFCLSSSSMLIHLLVHSSVARYVPDGVLVFGTITCIVGPVGRVTAQCRTLWEDVQA